MIFFFHLNVDIWRPLNTSEKCKSCKTHQRVVLGLAGARVSGCPLHRGGKTWLCTRVISPVARHPRHQGGQATLCLMHPRENVGQRPHTHCVALTVFNSYLKPFLLSFWDDRVAGRGGGGGDTNSWRNSVLLSEEHKSRAHQLSLKTCTQPDF